MLYSDDRKEKERLPKMLREMSCFHEADFTPKYGWKE
jgi:hypothetical protein